MLPLLTWTWPETPIVLVVIVVLAFILRLILARVITTGVEASV